MTWEDFRRLQERLARRHLLLQNARVMLLAHDLLRAESMDEKRSMPIEPRRVLIIVEDETLGELLAETLRDAGHATLRLEEEQALEAELRARRFDSVVVDLDTRAHDGARLVARLRAAAPASTIVALLPCGGLLAGDAHPGYHVAIEKPARLGAVLSAVQSRPKP